MRLGLLTAPFPDTPLDEVAAWAGEAGFQALEIACWPKASGESRRYAGTCHIDVMALSDGEAREIPGRLAEKGISISALGYYPNTLSPDKAYREAVIGHSGPAGRVADGHRQAPGDRPVAPGEARGTQARRDRPRA